jgi:PAS domain S-box-containing protein
MALAPRRRAATDGRVVHILRFTDASVAGLTAIPLHYDPWLVVASCLIAIAGAYAALRITWNLPALERGRRRWLLVGAALAMGVGVWAMHFVGMLALDTPLRITYAAGLTAISILPAILASALCLHVTGTPHASVARIAFGGSAMGFGIGAMHYLGMAAMRAPADMRYDPATFVLSLLAAIVLATVAMTVVGRTRAVLKQQPWMLAASSVLLGAAVSVMHYIGMAAARFFPAAATGYVAAGIDEQPLAVMVTLGTVAVIAAVIGAASIEGRIRALDAHVRGQWRQLTAAMQGISEGFILFDESRRAIVWNSLIEEMLPQLKGLLEPEARYAVLFPAAESPIAQARWVVEGSNKIRQSETPLADGRSLLIRETATASGHLVVSCTDITAHKRAKERLRSFFDKAPYASIAVNALGIIVHANRAALDMFGYKAEELIGQSCCVLAATERRQHMVRLVERLLQGSRETSTGHIARLGVRKNGVKFPLEVMHGVLDFGSESLVVFAIADVTERQRIEAQLRHSQKMETVGQLTGGLAHDFNNLLTVVMGNLQLLEPNVAADPQSREQVRDALDAAERGAELTRRMLAFARRQLLAPQAADINRLVTEIAPLLKKTVTEEVEITTKCAADLWLVEVDKSQLESALLNLAINARDAMPEGGKLTIETENVSFDDIYTATHPDVGPGDYVRLVVTDSGTGMSKEVQEKAFEPFFTTKEGSGSGLGLSMVYGFVKQSKGHVGIYSEVGYGTSVRIYLPRLDKSFEDTTIVTVSRRIVPSGKERILLVEDDTAVRRAVAQLLENLGYTVAEAANGAKALALLDDDETRFDLLLTDVVMPGGMSGLELSKRARERDPDLKVLLTSGYTDTAMLARGVLQPTDQILNKPYRRADLARKVRSVLDQSSTVSAA